MSAGNYSELRDHAGHEIECATYADVNVTIECMTCSTVLLSFDNVPEVEPWDNDAIQFPRLLAEIVAAQEDLDYAALEESMELSHNQLEQLFDRAQSAWERIKEAL